LKKGNAVYSIKRGRKENPFLIFPRKALRPSMKIISPKREKRMIEGGEEEKKEPRAM